MSLQAPPTAKTQIPQALNLLAKELLGYPATSVNKALKAGELIEIEVDDDG